MKRFKGLLGLFFCISVAGGMVPLHAEQTVQWSGNNHYYEAISVTNGISWSAAQADATVRGGYLATATSEVENNFIYSLIQPAIFWSDRSGPWIGGLQPAGSPEPGGNWQWISGEPWGFESWDAIEPNNGGGIEDRVQFWKKSTLWNDKVANQYAFGYVIEYQIHTSATGELSVAIGSVETILAGYPLELVGMLDGMASMLVWDFGDSTYATNTHFSSRAWSMPGNYDVVLTAFNGDHAGGVSSTQTVQVVTLEDVAIHVSLNGDDANDGSSWASAKATLQAGIDAQSYENGFVLVSNGTYAVTNEIVLQKNIAVRGVNGPDVTIIDGGGSNRCFNLESSACTIGGFTITNGYHEVDGGGISCDNTTPVITNCIIIGCTAGDEGGGVNRGTLYDCTLSQNLALNHAGGLNNGIAYDCTFSSNTASNNGGAAEWSNLYDCIIENNTAGSNGGGLRYGTGDGCRIMGNTAKWGGGSQSADLVKCEIFENNASIHGGGVSGGASELYRCNIYSNTAAVSAGGVANAHVYNCRVFENHAQSGGGGGKWAYFYNCLVANNTSDAWGGGLNDSLSYNCTIIGNHAKSGGGGISIGTNLGRDVRNSIIYQNSTTVGTTQDIDVNANRTAPGAYSSCSSDLGHGMDGNITNAPLLLADSHLLPNSPCIGAGDYSNAVDTDIDGEAWLNPPSMGCDEYPGAGVVFGEISVMFDTPSNSVTDVKILMEVTVKGALTALVWEFGDGATASNATQVSHAWNTPGIYSMVLTAYNDTWPAGVSATQTIEIISREEATVYVAADGDDVNDGSSWTLAKATIQAGVDAQPYTYGLVLVSNGTYAVTHEITVDKVVTVQSLNGATETVVDGGGSNRCFNLGDSACIISGFTITNGYSFRDEGGGGGIFCSDTIPVVTNCLVIGCSSHGDAGGVRGGAVYNSELCYNISSWFGSGGGAYSSRLYNCSIHHNQSTGKGGGIADCPLYNCTITANRASGSGGGAWFINSDFEVRNSIIYENRTAGIQQKEITVNSGSLEALKISGSCSPELFHGIDGNITNSPGLASCWNLSPQSPCRGSGFSRAVGTDFDGEQWLNPPSMGCDEYLGAETVTGRLDVAIAGYFSATVGHQIDLEARINGSATTHIWNFGDGLVVSNIPVVAHTWESPGSYNVVLTAYNDTWSGGVSATQLVRVVSEESIILWEETGHYYQSVMVPDKLTWKEAKGEAASRGGYLASADTLEENDFIYSLVQSTNYWNGVGPWLGGFQPVGSMEPDGNWQWISGASVVEPNWNLGEPNDSNGGQNRICFWAHSSRWDDNVDTARSGAYVIEYQIHPSATGSLSVEIDGDEDIVAGTSLELIGILDGLATKLVWDFGNGNTITNIQMPSHAWGTPGNYEVVLTAFNADHPSGVSATRTIQVFSVMAATMHVALSGNDINDGLSWSSAKATIQEGVDAVIEGGVVLVSNGTYAVMDEIVVGKNITIESMNGAESTLIDGGSSNRCFQLGGDVCVISGFTLANGYSTNNGGAVMCLDTTQIISNCVIKGCVSGRLGGGIRKGTLYTSKLVENHSEYRAGGASDSVLYNSLVSGNSAENNSGGIQGGDAYNCTIVNNQAGAYGGGVNNSTLINCIITDNAASRGGNNLYGSNTMITNSCSPDITLGTAGNIMDAPLFVDAANGIFNLLPDSPCINWGNNAGVAQANDLDGNPRITEGYVDIGCYEYQGIIGEADSDEDGLLDTWEHRWFGGNVLPENNADGDRQSNGAEYVSGTDPTNSTSFFKSIVTKSDAENGPFIIEWAAISGRVYNVYWTPSLMEDFQPLEVGILYPQSSYTDTVHSAESSGYYRVVVMRADYDADGDGLPNDWESQYAVADSFADGDHDGFNNVAEFIAGTDPTNEDSFFKAANEVVEVDGTNCFVVEWISIPDRLYSVQWSTNLFSSFQTLESGIEYPQDSYTDTVHAAQAGGYYKVDVKLK